METPYAKEGEKKREAAMHKEPQSKPFGAGVAGPLDPEQDHLVISSLGPVPLGLDEAYPFAQSVLPRLDGLDREHMGWVGETKDLMLAAHDLMPGIPGPGLPGEDVSRDLLQVLRTADYQFGLGAGAVLSGLAPAAAVHAALAAHPDGDPADAIPVCRARADAVAAAISASEPTPLRCDSSKKTGKMRTAHLDDHVLSLRAGDGLFTLKPAGAALLHAALPAPVMRVVVAADSVPFNREGKSVFAQFVLSMDPALRPGDECLVVDEADALIAIGQVLLAPDEVGDFERGMAVKVRDGFQA